VDCFLINGGPRLRGAGKIDGAKNAALPIMAATILCEGPTVLRGVPNLMDVDSMALLLGKLGVSVSRLPDGAMRLCVEYEMNCHA